MRSTIRPERAILAAMLSAVAFQHLITAPATAADTQGEMRQLPASAAPPPELAQIEAQKAQAPPAAVRASKQELAKRIALQPGAAVRLENAEARRPEKALAASAVPPPEVTAIDAEMRQLPAASGTLRSTKQELEAVIQKQIGGIQKLQRARQSLNPGVPQETTSLLDFLGIGTAHAAAAPADVSITLTPQTDSTGFHASLISDSAIAWATIVGSVVSFMSPTNSSASLTASSINWGDGTSSTVARPYIHLTFNAPKAGYYIVSVRSSGSAGVQLKHYANGQYETLQTFQDSGTADRPALVNLGAGSHYFYWVFPGNSKFYSASIDSYP